VGRNGSLFSPRRTSRPGGSRKGYRQCAKRSPKSRRLRLRYYEPELDRLEGELVLASNEPGAEASFRKAIAIARAQQAKAFELRAALSLARLWRRQGRRDAARDLLAPVYAWFTEGFDTADLMDAKALLDKFS
jgi:predicted ATPase